MSDTSPAIPESIDPANQHKTLTAGQQAVIKKLFRRLIVFLFVLFIFSFLDRINIGFAGLTMGRDLGLSATMFGLATTLFYAAYVIFGIPSNIMLSMSVRGAGSPPSWCSGASPLRPPCLPLAPPAYTYCVYWLALPKPAFCLAFCCI